MENREFIRVIKKQQRGLNRVVPFDPRTDILCGLDLTAGNTELTDQVLEDTRLFTRYINNKLKTSSARYAIGGYNEHRTVYRKREVFDAVSAGKEPRRLHLGVDIWGKPATPVMAPLDGLVHSFAFNNRAGDYGATIILTHRLEQVYFYTLYGHLSLASIRNLQEGQRIKRGDVFAEFGIPLENGQWPPHLHFQLILDLNGWKGDYPGVCPYNEKDQWLANSPDGDLLLQMNRFRISAV